jgi:hypothetical protein
MPKRADKSTLCAEHGIWTSVPTPPPAGQKPLDFNAIDAKENQRILSSERMSFSMVGCSGDPSSFPRVTRPRWISTRMAVVTTANLGT